MPEWPCYFYGIYSNRFPMDSSKFDPYLNIARMPTGQRIAFRIA
jgi:hypothetical protein